MEGDRLPFPVYREEPFRSKKGWVDPKIFLTSLKIQPLPELPVPTFASLVNPSYERHQVSLISKVGTITTIPTIHQPQTFINPPFLVLLDNYPTYVYTFFLSPSSGSMENSENRTRLVSYL